MNRYGNLNTTIEKNQPSRTERKKKRTRTNLLEAAYALMSTKGVDATTIAEIADTADVAFGTFYNYFKTKDEIAACVIDCVIKDLGRRNDEATKSIKETNTAAVQALSIRITIQEMLTNPMWKWWLKRPEFLVERLIAGFYEYGTRDLKLAIQAGRYEIDEQDVDAMWSQQMWMLAGGVKALLDGQTKGLNEKNLIESIMRAMGVPAKRASEIATLPLPEISPAHVEFS